MSFLRFWQLEFVGGASRQTEIGYRSVTFVG